MSSTPAWCAIAFIPSWCSTSDSAFSTYVRTIEMGTTEPKIRPSGARIVLIALATGPGASPFQAAISATCLDS